MCVTVIPFPYLRKMGHKLWEYASLVNRVKENLADGMARVPAVEEAVTYCLNQGILTDFLKTNRSGVMGMLRLLTEYDEKEHMRRLKRDARIEGALQQSRQDIFELLEDIGPVPEDIQTQIRAEENMDILRDWHKAAARASDMNDFQEKMNRIAVNESKS